MRTIWKLGLCLALGASCSYGGLVTIVTTDDQDKPLEQAEVLVINESTRAEVHKVTDRWGRAYLGWMDSGSYTVAARYRGETIAEKALSITPKPIEVHFKRARLNGLFRPPVPMERLDRLSTGGRPAFGGQWADSAAAEDRRRIHRA